MNKSLLLKLSPHSVCKIYFQIMSFFFFKTGKNNQEKPVATKTAYKVNSRANDSRAVV